MEAFNENFRNIYFLIAFFDIDVILIFCFIIILTIEDPVKFFLELLEILFSGLTNKIIFFMYSISILFDKNLRILLELCDHFSYVLLYFSSVTSIKGFHTFDLLEYKSLQEIIIFEGRIFDKRSFSIIISIGSLKALITT